MRSNPLLAILGTAALLATFAGSVSAQPPVHSNLPMQGHPRMGGMLNRMGVRPGAGSIIGNKNTKVYHLAGDKGNMPAEKNRVYFRTEREAMAAGFHRAGVRVVNHHPVIHPRGSMMHPMSGGSMNGHLPK